MTLVNFIIYFLLALGIALVVLGVVVLAQQLLRQGAIKDAAHGAQAAYMSGLVIVIGIAGLGTSAFLSLRKPVSPAPEPTAAGRTASSRPAPTTSAVSSPAVSAPAPAPTSTPSSQQPKGSGSVTLSAPSPGSKVQQCDVFTGTSSLPVDKTIVVGVRNLDNTGHTSYLAPVSNWDKPNALAHWADIQYFGSGDTSIGQTYLVSVIVMSSDVVRHALAEPANRDSWAVTSLPSGSKVKRSLRLTRVAGPGPATCASASG
jgi:hypothetical protein